MEPGPPPDPEGLEGKRRFGACPRDGGKRRIMEAAPWQQLSGDGETGATNRGNNGLRL